MLEPSSSIAPSPRTGDQGAARHAVRGWKVTFQVDSFERQLERQLKTVRKEVLQLDHERMAPSTLTEVHSLLRALQRFVKKSASSSSADS